MRLIDLDEFAKLSQNNVADLSSLEEELDINYVWDMGYLECLKVLDSCHVLKAIPIDKPFLKMRYGDYVVYNKKWLVDHLQTEWNILQGKEYQPSIPVEWIKDRLKKALAFTHSKAEGNIIDNGCVVTVVSASFTAQVLANLLEAWEGEHETK